jgi:sugar fermentation stimulation protein A
MDFSTPLVPATLLRRYKRFLADVRLEDGQELTAHCANPGAMLGLANLGARVWLSPSPNPKAKLPYRWEIEAVDDTLVGINTSHPNAIVSEALAAGAIAELTGYTSVRREVPYSANSRIDLLLEGPAGRCFVEVKNVHWKRAGQAAFPDSVTSRGAKHLADLAGQVRAGDRAVMLYCVQRDDVDALSIAADLDATYGAAFTAALAQGVQAYAYTCMVSPLAIRLHRRIPLV